MRRRGLLSALASLPFAPLAARVAKAAPVSGAVFGRLKMGAPLPGLIAGLAPATTGGWKSRGQLYAELTDDLSAVSFRQAQRTAQIVANIPQAITSSADRQIDALRAGLVEPLPPGSTIMVKKAPVDPLAALRAAFAAAVRARTEIAAQGPHLPSAGDAGEGAVPSPATPCLTSSPMHERLVPRFEPEPDQALDQPEHAS